jgi:hypothetical protein
MPNALMQVLRPLRIRSARRRWSSSPIGVDCLEARVLPTATVTFTGAALTITGDTGSNNITVERVGSQLHIDANGGSIRVLGSDVPEFFFNLNGSFNLTATFQSDADALEISSGLQLKSANINMGDGPNAVSISGVSLSGKLTLVGGDDGNAIAIAQASVAGVTLIDTGDDGDAIAILESRFAGATTIQTDGDGDAIAISGGAFRTKFGGKLTISTGDTGDALAISKVDCKAISIDTGGDANGDAVALADVLVAGGVSVKTGGGGDALAVVGIVQSGGAANLFDVGSDNDAIALAQSSFSGATTINLGNGPAGNALGINDVSFNSAFTLNSQGVGDNIGIETNAGAAGATTFAKAAKFNFGADSSVFISTASAATKTNFLSTVSFSSPLPASTVTADPLNASFAKPPKLKNVLLV